VWPGDLKGLVGEGIPPPSADACVIDQRSYGRAFVISGVDTAVFMRDVIVVNSAVKSTAVASRRLRRRLTSENGSLRRRNLLQNGVPNAAAPSVAPFDDSRANNATTANNATVATKVLLPDAETPASAPQHRGGGAFFVHSGARLYLQDVYVAGCSAPNGGAIAVVGKESALRVTDGSISRNTAVYSGGTLLPIPAKCGLFSWAWLTDVSDWCTVTVVSGGSALRVTGAATSQDAAVCVSGACCPLRESCKLPSVRGRGNPGEW
jgi:hypothetical protein